MMRVRHLLPTVVVVAMSLMGVAWVDTVRAQSPRESLRPEGPAQTAGASEQDAPGLSPLTTMQTVRRAGRPAFTRSRGERNRVVLRRVPAGEPQTFYADHLLPMVSSRLETLAPQFHPRAMEAYGRREVLDPGLSRDARRQLEKGTLDAVKSFVLESTALESSFDRLIDVVRRRAPGRKAASWVADTDGEEPPATGRGAGDPSRRGKDRVRFQLGMSSGAPKLEVRYGTSFGELRLRLTGRGDTGLEFKRSATSETRVWFGYNAEDERYGVAYRLSF